jgi:HEAT repeat protein
MWVCYVIALIPLVLGAALWLRTRRITFVEWMVGSLVGLLVAVGFHIYAIASLGMDIRIVSGPVSHATYYPRYSGDETDFSWGDHWAVTIDFGNGRADLEISRKEFEEIREKFGATELESAPPEIRVPKKKEYRVFIARNRTGALIPAWTVRLARPQETGLNLFSFSKPPEGLSLFDYPHETTELLIDAMVDRVGRGISGETFWEAKYIKHDWRRSNRLLGRAATDINIGSWDALNAKLGPDLGVNLIAIGFDGESRLAHWQEAKWLGGKRNDLIVCYGPLDTDRKPAWAYCFGWTESEHVKRNLESLLLTRGPGDGLMSEIEKEVRAHYRPKAWPEFSYLSVRPPRGAVPILILVTIFVQGTYWIRALLNRQRRQAADIFEEREQAEEAHRKWQKQQGKTLEQRLKRELGHLGRRPAIDALTEEMLRGREQVLAAVALTRRREQEARGALVLGVTSENREVRSIALDWLNDHVRRPSECKEARTVVPRLIQRLDDPGVATRREARRLLELIDPDWRCHDEARRGIHDLKMKLQVKQPDHAVLDALGARGPLVHDDLVELAQDLSKATAAHALRALGRSGEPRVIPLLLERIDAEKNVLRWAAIDGLAGFGPGLKDVPEASEIFEKVRPFLATANTGVRNSTITILGCLGDDRALPELVPFLANAVSATRVWTAEAIGRIVTPAAIEALVERLEAAAESDRPAIIRVLGKTGDPAIVPPLIALFEKKCQGKSPVSSEMIREIDIEVAAEVIDAIYPIKNRDVKKLIKNAAEDFFCPVHEHAARRLPHVGEGPDKRPWSA